MPGERQLPLRVLACGVCRTDLHIADGDRPQARYPIVLGHEIVGEVTGLGANVTGFAIGERVGVPWLGATCGHCRFCLAGQENLCDNAHFTGCDIDGGYAERAVADARFCFKLPAGYGNAEAAPLLGAGLAVAADAAVRTSVTALPLEQANEALSPLRDGSVIGRAGPLPLSLGAVIGLADDRFSLRPSGPTAATPRGR